MHYRNKIYSLLLVLNLLLFAFSLINTNYLFANNSAKKMRVLCTTFPVYLFTKNITDGSDYFIVDLLVDSAATNPDNHALTPYDLERIALADVLIINGLGLEKFLDKALRIAKPDVIVINSSIGVSTINFNAGRLDLKALEETDSTIKKSNSGKDYNRQIQNIAGKNNQSILTQATNDSTKAMQKDYYESPVTNPYIFASPRCAIQMVSNITMKLANIDRESSELYFKNAENFMDALLELDKQITILSHKNKGVKIITYNNAFDYLTKDLGLEIIANIEPDHFTSPSDSRIMLLAKAAQLYNAMSIWVTPNVDRKASILLGQEAKLPVLVIDTVASAPANAPLDYYQKVMNSNIQVLKQVLPY